MRVNFDRLELSGCFISNIINKHVNFMSIGFLVGGLLVIDDEN